METISMEETATGCVSNAGDPYTLYNNKGNRITDEEARELLLNGETIEHPNAGANGYREICERLELGVPEVLDWTSSAGDWCFEVGNRALFQENRYPGHGFKYIMGDLE
jgi:hypothetical protein